jgi:hypothetical protein
LRGAWNSAWNTASLAHELLTAATSGEGARVDELGSELAEKVLTARHVILAQRVLAGGAHARSSAIELASLLVEAQSAPLALAPRSKS